MPPLMNLVLFALLMLGLLLWTGSPEDSHQKARRRR